MCVPTHTAVQIGFSQSTYSTSEDKLSVTFGVELIVGMSAIPIKFTVMDVEGTAQSTFCQLFNLGRVSITLFFLTLGGQDYEGLSVELTLMPGQASYQYSISIFNDFTAEMFETFTLLLHTQQSRVNIPSGFSQATVTIIDGPGKSCQVR